MKHVALQSSQYSRGQGFNPVFTCFYTSNAPEILVRDVDLFGCLCAQARPFSDLINDDTCYDKVVRKREFLIGIF